MKNSLIVASLGIVFAISLVGVKLTGNAQQVYKEKNAQINEINAEIANNKKGKYSFLKKYDINELKKGYSEPTISDEKTIIDVPIINQFPELPTGCEIASAAAMLNYIGFNVDKVFLEENFLTKSNDFHFNTENKLVGPDPYKVFVGNPKGDGFGCYSTVIVDTMNKYFESQKSANYAVDVLNSDQKTLEILLDNGIPVEVWASKEMKSYKYSEKNKWIIEPSGEAFRWASNSHVLVLVGYDTLNYYFADCDNKTEIQAYEKTLFLKRWEQLGKQAVIIKIN